MKKIISLLSMVLASLNMCASQESRSFSCTSSTQPSLQQQADEQSTRQEKLSNQEIAKTTDCATLLPSFQPPCQCVYHRNAAQQDNLLCDEAEDLQISGLSMQPVLDLEEDDDMCCVINRQLSNTNASDGSSCPTAPQSFLPLPCQESAIAASDTCFQMANQVLGQNLPPAQSPQPQQPQQITTTNEQLKLLKCEDKDCPEKFLRKWSVQSHMTYAHLEPRSDYKCDKCSASYRSKSSLKRHENIHLALCQQEVNQDYIRRFPCAFCFLVFKRDIQLRQHIRAVHGKQRPYVCTEYRCPERFTRSGDMNVHVQVVHVIPRREYCCEKCSASFKFLNGLSKHEKKHV